MLPAAVHTAPYLCGKRAASILSRKPRSLNTRVEDGTSEGGEDFDWVTPFEDDTGCQVNVTYADTSDEMVTLMRQGGGSVYDGVSASGDASVRLITGGDVGAIDPSLFPEFANVIGPLDPESGTNNRHYVIDGNVYGTPYMYGPNFLMFNTDVVSPAPTSWDVVFESDSPYAGSVTEKTTHCPSGLGTGAPTRFINHISSCVIAFFPELDWAVTKAGVMVAKKIAQTANAQTRWQTLSKRVMRNILLMSTPNEDWAHIFTQTRNDLHDQPTHCYSFAQVIQ